MAKRSAQTPSSKMHSAVLAEHLPTFKRAGLFVSGGVDSIALLWLFTELFEAQRIVALHADTPLAEGWELDECRRVCEKLGVDLRVIRVDTFSISEVKLNGRTRCYACKSAMADALLSAGSAEGADTFFDATTAQEIEQERPGMRALAERGIYSPFTKFDISRNELHEYANMAGLDPSVRSGSCMATRFPLGMPLSTEQMERLRLVEEKLRAVGFPLVRARLQGDRKTVLVQADRDAHQRLSENLPFLRELADSSGYSIHLHERPYSGIQ
ncbi:MAG: hypothetical protein U5N86_07290 [Planctomycetota bacterium]|nr:hypothetical protein [Planctomycetota bacterium]